MVELPLTFHFICVLNAVFNSYVLELSLYWSNQWSSFGFIPVFFAQVFDFPISLGFLGGAH